MAKPKPKKAPGPCKRRGCPNRAMEHTRGGPAPVFCSIACKEEHHRFNAARRSSKCCPNCTERASRDAEMNCLECRARELARGPRKPPRWSPEEWTILDGNYGRNAWTIQSLLYKASGVPRTQKAIYQMARTRGLTAADAGDGVPIPQVAEAIGISLRAVHELIKRERIQSIRFGKYRFVPLDEFERVLERYRPVPAGWITLGEMSARLGIFQSNCHKAAVRGALPAMKSGKVWYVDGAYVDAVARHWRSVGGNCPNWEAGRALVEGVFRPKEALA